MKRRETGGDGEVFPPRPGNSERPELSVRTDVRSGPHDCPPVAPRPFTDREDLLRVFRDALAGETRGRRSVLVFYGVGGIGKTSLRRELARMLRDQKDVVHATVDFETASYRDPETALFALRKELRDTHKVPFPTLDIAYTIYWRKVHPQMPFNRDSFPLWDDGLMVADVFELAKDIPIVGILPRLAKLAARAGSFLADWWTRRGSQELRDLPSLEPTQIAERLPMFWASDFSEFLAGERKRAVLFLDTYEALWQGERSEGQLLTRDDWIRSLVDRLPEVLWVICGREKLRWAEADEKWNKRLEQHLVGDFADPDANSYLAACGVRESDVRQAIVASSQGVPYNLDLSVDTYLEIRKKELPKPSDFAMTPRKLFERFLRHLTREEVETLKVLSAPRFWTHELFEVLVREFQTGFPLTAFTDLCRFSFINEGAQPNTWTMHQLMRESLQQHEDAELRGREHRFLLDFYSGRLKTATVRSILPEHREALAEGSYHAGAVLGPHEHLAWFTGSSQVFYDAAQRRMLTSYYEQMTESLERALGPNDAAVATSLNNLAQLLKATNRLSEAEPLMRRALAIDEQSYGKDHPNVAIRLNNLAQLLKYTNRLGEAEPLMRRVVSIFEKSYGENHPQVATALNNLAQLLQDTNRLGEAEPLMRRALAIDEQSYGKDHPDVARDLNNLAQLLKATNRLGEAEPLMLRVLAILLEFTRATGHPHPHLHAAIANYAGLLEAMGRSEAEVRNALNQLLGPVGTSPG